MMRKKCMLWSMIYTSLFICSQLYAMEDDAPKREQRFQRYLCAGKIAREEIAMSAQLIDIAFNKLEKTMPMESLITDISTPAYAGQLKNLPSSEIAARYEKYRILYNTLISTLFLTTSISNAHNQDLSLEDAQRLSGYTAALEERKLKTSQWLTAIRNSGEEDYLGRCLLDLNDRSNTTPKEFWKSIFKPVVLSKLKELYVNKIYLDQRSMIILQKQLDAGFEDNDDLDTNPLWE